jgi:hypothetical protein
MLQHNGYSRTGWLASRGLWQFVHHGLTPAMARRKNRTKVVGRRTWVSPGREARQRGADRLEPRRRVTLDTPEAYCAGVRRWAESVLADSERLARDARHTA